MQTKNNAMFCGEKAPKVSVCVVTYNQEKYIRQCLQSIVDQETDFDFEVLVADDCSTDGTRTIVREFADRYSGVVTPIFHERNIGAYANYMLVHQQAKGEYVAHVDGDDYYFNNKLQLQANILDREPKCNVVWHRMLSLAMSGKIYKDNFDALGLTRRKITLHDIISNITIGFNSSKMYRRNALHTPPACNPDYIDFADNVLRLSSGDSYACFVGDESLGVYRANQGISFRQNSRIRNSIYRWLYFFYEKKIADRSTINAKLFWLFVSDVRHMKRTAVLGAFLFAATMGAFRLKAINNVRVTKSGAVNMFTECDRNALRGF